MRSIADLSALSGGLPGLIRPTEDQPSGSLLCLHGFGGTAIQWLPVMRAARPGIGVLSVDLPGHGHSPLPIDTPLNEIVERLLGLLADVALPAPLVVIGHSLGGILAMHLAASPRVHGLVLLCTAARLGIHPDLLERPADDRLDDIVSASIGDALPGEVATLVAQGLRRLAAGPATASAWGLAGDRAAPLDLGRLHVPTVVVTCRDDRVVSPRRSRQLANAIPGAGHVALRQSGHYPHLSAPAAIADVAADLLRTIDVSRRPGRGERR